VKAKLRGPTQVLVRYDILRHLSNSTGWRGGRWCPPNRNSRRPCRCRCKAQASTTSWRLSSTTPPRVFSGSTSTSLGASGATVRWSQGYPRRDKRRGSCGSDASAASTRKSQGYNRRRALTLSRTTTDNAANRAKAGNAGAVEAVVAAMRTYREDVELQRAACMTLARMATDNADNRGKAGNAGAVEAVVAAMRWHAQRRRRAATGSVHDASSHGHRQC